jgi:thioredoxin
MKKLSFLLVASLVITSCSYSQNNNDSKTDKTTSEKQNSFIKNVDAQIFKKLSESGEGITLDVRTPEEIAQGQIPNASSINLYDPEFEKKINLMQKDKDIYVYCKAGGRSAQAAEILSKNGFKHVYNLDGGFMAWERNNFPRTQPTAEADKNIQTFTLSDFKDLIKKNEVVLIDFHTIWCAPCKKMAPVIDEIEKEYTGKATIKRIDIDKSKDVGAAYDITGVPVFVLFVKGEQKWKHNGMISKEELQKQIEPYIKK